MDGLRLDVRINGVYGQVTQGRSKHFRKNCGRWLVIVVEFAAYNYLYAWSNSEVHMNWKYGRQTSMMTISMPLHLFKSTLWIPYQISQTITHRTPNMLAISNEKIHNHKTTLFSSIPSPSPLLPMPHFDPPGMQRSHNQLRPHSP